MRSSRHRIVVAHDLRHRRISLLRTHGMTWAQIGERVGSRNIAVLAQTYTHVLLDDARKVDYETLLRSRESTRRSVTRSTRRDRMVRTSVRTSTTEES